MLKTMRKNVKSLAPTLWIVIATFIIAIFAVWGGAGRLGEKARSETVATVGGEKISMNAYFNVLRHPSEWAIPRLKPFSLCRLAVASRRSRGTRVR